jgi:tRNA threonylcarbamoyl adenosine modification protein YjeE
MLILSVEEMQALAVRLADILRPGDCVALSGDLGAGKTIFVQSLIDHLSNELVGVTSPTFTLLQTYDVTLKGHPTTIWHYDLYRLEDAMDLQELALEDALDQGIAIIEWPEIVLSLLPSTRIHITIDFGEGEMNRYVVMSAEGEPMERLLAAGLVSTS